MTLEEAQALVLCEGLVTKPDFDDAVPLMLHQGDSPALERMSRLAEAIDIVHEAIENDTVIDKRLAGALWIIGVVASESMDKNWSSEEQDSIRTVFNSVESALVGFWPVGHPRDKDKG